MATYTGILFTDVDSPPIEFVGSAIANASLDLPLAPYIDDASLEVAGTWQNNFPLDMPKNELVGVYPTGFVDDYYFRFWVVPYQFSEFVISDVECTFTLWNAFFDSAVCEDVDITNSSEIELELATGEPPFTLGALRSRTFTATIPEDGSAQFLSLITFVFTGYEEEGTCSIKGTRLVVFAPAPQINMVESLSWLTDIHTGRTGIEQRMSLLAAPRQSYEITVFLKGEQDQSALDAMLHSWCKKGWGIPCWSQWTQHATTITTGDEIVYLDTSYAEYKDGGLALVWVDENNHEVLAIDTVESDRLNLSSAVLATWTGPKFIMPLHIAFMSPETLRRSETPDGDGSFVVTFLIRDNAEAEGYTASLTHETLPVFTRAGLVPGSQEVSISSGVSLIDYSASDFTIVDKTDGPIHTLSLAVRNVGRQECWEFRQFLSYLAGRRKAFFVPTYKEDMIQTVSMDSTATTLVISKIGITEFMGLTELRTHLAFCWSDGTVIPRRIESVQEDGDTEVLVLSSAPGVAIDPGDCTICWLDKVRLASDSVSLTWEEPDVNTCTLKLMKVAQ